MYVRLGCCKHYVKHVVSFVNHLKGMISSWGNPGAIPSTFPPWVGSYKSPPTLSFEHLISQDPIISTKIPACQDEASPQGLCPRCRSWLRRPSELSHATAPEIQQVRHLDPGNENSTSVGPAYIMGLGKMAMTVDSLSSSPSSSTALCCSILTARGTSSSLVQPPRGCSSRTGRLYPLDSNCRLWKVSLINENMHTSSIVQSFLLFHCIVRLVSLVEAPHLQSDMRRACPLWIGFLSWKAKTASAFSSLNFSLNCGLKMDWRAKYDHLFTWWGVSLNSSRPSCQVTLPSTSRSPPTSQDPDAMIIWVDF